MAAARSSVNERPAAATNRPRPAMGIESLYGYERGIVEGGYAAPGGSRKTPDVLSTTERPMSRRRILLGQWMRWAPA